MQLNLESIEADQRELDIFEAKKQKLYLRRSLTLTKIDENRQHWSKANKRILITAQKSSKLSIFADNCKNMIGAQKYDNSKHNDSKSSLATARSLTSGIKMVKISNIGCFIKYEIFPETKTCILKIFTRIRPGYVEKRVENIEIESFNINELFSRMQLTIRSNWN